MAELKRSERFWRSIDVLGARLLVLALIVFLPAFALIILGTFEQQRLNKETTRQAAMTSAKLTAAAQDYYVRHTQQLLTTLTNVGFLMFAQERRGCDVHFRNLTYLSPDFVDFGLVETNGRLFSSAVLTNAAPDLSGYSFFQKALQTKRFSVGLLDEDTVSGVPSLRMSCPVINSNGALVRVLYASLRLSVLSKDLHNIPSPVGSTISVLDRAGTIVARYPADGWLARNVSREPLGQAVLKGRDHLVEINGLDGAHRLYALSSVSDSVEPVLFAAYGIPTQLSFAQAKKSLIRNLSIMLLVAVVVLAAALLYAQRLLIRPVNEIASAASRLARGDLLARTGVRSGPSEIRHLASAFDEMAEHLTSRNRELTKANKRINEMNLELEERVRERTRELEAFTYSVSHDLRAPLRHMGGFASILLEATALKNDAESRAYVARIQKSASEMGSLIDSLLEFARLGREPLNRESVDMNDLVQTVIAQLMPDYTGREIHWHVSPLHSVSGDPALLKQVWVNLISNAIKYTRSKTPAQIDVAVREENDCFVFFVRDNGAGFDPKLKDRLFGVFQRLHSSADFEGIGIGLANAQRIVRRHGGTMWAEGEVGKGATFFFSFPKLPVNGSGN